MRAAAKSRDLSDAIDRAERAERGERDLRDTSRAALARVAELERERDEALAEVERERAVVVELVDASERLLEYYSDGLPDHLVDEFRAALAKVRPRVGSAELAVASDAMRAAEVSDAVIDALTKEGAR